MKANEINYFTIGPRLTFTFILLILLILGGNGLLIWQFQTARLQTYRSTGVTQELIAVLELQQSLLSFHLRLDELARSEDAHRLATDGAALQKTLLEQTQRTRSALTSSSLQSAGDPALLPTLQAIEITLPTQVEAIAGLAQSGDWDAVRLRLGNELKPLETQTSILVDRVNQQVSKEMMHAFVNMERVQRRILVIVPSMAILTFSLAAFFGWSIARRLIELRLEERVNERTRIARDLHDTLLQSFQGLLMKYELATDMLPNNAIEAQKLFESTTEQARKAIIEGREAVYGLRASTVVTNELARAVSNAGEELAATAPDGNRPEFRVLVEGASKDIVPLIRDEIYRIACEALRNAFRHAHARHVGVEICYDPRKFRLRIYDDGRGIDPEVLASGGKSQHYGLPGMQERARLVSGKLTVLSRPDSGTEIELTIAASMAYIKSSAKEPVSLGKGA